MNNDERREIAAVLETADFDTLKEIIREGEAFLEAQLKAGLAADQRAMAVVTMSSAIGAILIAGTVSFIAAKVVIWPHVLAVVPMFIGLFVAMFSALSAAKPVTFYYTGNNPKFWVQDVVKKQTLLVSLAGQAANYAKGISLNKNVLDDNHRNVGRALSALIYGVSFAVVIEAAILVGILVDR
jgi:hypothetical protein